MKSEKLVVAPTLREVIQKLFLADDGMLVGLGGKFDRKLGHQYPQICLLALLHLPIFKVFHCPSDVLWRLTCAFDTEVESQLVHSALPCNWTLLALYSFPQIDLLNKYLRELLTGYFSMLQGTPLAFGLQESLQRLVFLIFGNNQTYRKNHAK